MLREEDLFPMALPDETPVTNANGTLDQKLPELRKSCDRLHDLQQFLYAAFFRKQDLLYRVVKLFVFFEQR